ncbi:MacB family efflux pump subunit [Pararhizobium mangrovi]|uniref:Pyoverdine export ATP-binding/permease protein PvdT n=1 Tax=Pararhizobium mangrovi TaxID=2590452 RepID=A0A506U9U8_9HYPH|nr:MacB family efflux pump subunit [Pararhizobium mangrovi]TPW31212.1 MacB family efflux pump subunit [Pararhizobium mangrovi]
MSATGDTGATRKDGEPLIRLANVTRAFPSGEDTVTVLHGVDLTIEAGEMVAIIGSSGSGKSTLMNILGCLDRASEGSYLFRGKDVSALDAEERSALRREHFGFIFQRYQLLSELDAVENVEVPAVYAGENRSERRRRAVDLLTGLGLGDRLHHRPGQLSGGQQQRVSVARALMNGGDVILADEPTGALDTASGSELMKQLKALNRAGHTIIIVTHDREVAAEAERIIEISDGRILADTRKDGADEAHAVLADIQPRQRSALGGLGDGVREAMRMALRAMAAHKLRTFLTMLGIIIGIASVVSVVALGKGSQEAVLESISSIGTNTITIMPGREAGDRHSGRVHTLKPSDAEMLARQPYADSVTPQVSTSETAVFRDSAATVSVQGVGASYFRVQGSEFTAGRAFDESSVGERAQTAVIDSNAEETLFGDGTNPIGQVVILNKVPVRVIGVVDASHAVGPRSGSATFYLPYTTAMSRVMGRDYLEAITVRVGDGYNMDDAEAAISNLMTRLHRTQDFFLLNANTIRDTIESTGRTLTLLVSSIAVISLVVGGIGVMNIMLVSVTERTREIGIRMAVGARRGDILRQFLIEAVLVCATGGVAGVALSFVMGAGLSRFVEGTELSYSPATIVLACLSASLIGIVFGFMPARSAARLDPVVALARE